METSSENANNNTVTVNNVNLGYIFLHGGYAYSGYGDANNNTLNLYDVTVAHIHAGHSNYGTANFNTVNFFSGTVTSEMGAGYSAYGDVNYNTLNIHDGVFNGNVYGGRASYGGSSSGSATGNVLNIYGGTFNGDIYGGWAPDGNSIGNALNVYSSPVLSDANLYAGKAADDGISSGNDMNIHTSGIIAKNIYGFENLNFYLPESTVNGTKILTLTDSNGTDLSNTVLNVYADSATNLQEGDNVYLVTNNEGGLNLSNLTTSGKLSQGVSVEYAMNLVPLTNSDGKTVSMQATFGAPTASEQTKALNQGQVSNNQLVNIMNDKMVDWLPPIDFDDDPPAPPGVIEPKGYEIFMNMGFAKLKTKTGGGSEVETKGQSYDLGAARVLQQGSGPLYVAPIFQYGHGDYDTYLPNGLHGQGKNKFFMGGLIARKMNNNGFYYEGSFRGGKAENDFWSNDFKANGSNVRVSYDTSTPIFAGHLKVGKNLRLNKNNILDVYGIYFYTRQNGTGADLSTGEHYEFSSASSHRVKLGYKLLTRTSKISRIYTEMAYQYEKCSDVSATYANLSTPQAGDKGSSGMFQVGWLIKPSAKIPMMLDLNATAWAGHQRGVTAGIKFKRDF